MIFERIVVGDGGGDTSHPFKMTYDVAENSLSFDTDNTEVYVRGTNTYFAPTAGSEGKPGSITGGLTLEAGMTNYIYLESGWNGSSSAEPDTFSIKTYTSEKDLTEMETDGTIYYQSISRTSIGTVDVGAPDEEAGEGISQHVTTRLFAELFYVSSATVYLMVP